MSKYGDGPDEDVGKHSVDKVIGMADHECTIPVQSNEGPGQRSRRRGDVDEDWVGAVEEVQIQEVEEVDDLNHLSPDEVGADEEHHESEVEQIV